MLPARWRIPACRNIAVSRVSHQGAMSSGAKPSISSPVGAGAPSQTTSWVELVSATPQGSSPGCVIR